MLFRKYFNNLVLLPFFITTCEVSAASVVEGKCSNYLFQVKTYNGLDLFEMRYEVYSKSDQKKSKLIYKTDTGVFFHIACIRNKKEQDLLLFQEYCFGNACPESTYGIYNPNTQKIIIKPADWPNGNYQEVKKLIGYPPPFLVHDKRSFCCDKRQYEAGS